MTPERFAALPRIAQVAWLRNMLRPARRFPDGVTLVVQRTQTTRGGSATPTDWFTARVSKDGKTIAVGYGPTRAAAVLDAHASVPK